MTRLSPIGHTADSRELLMSVTGRVSLQLVHDAMPHTQQPDRCAWCNPAGCMWPRCLNEMGCTTGGAPTVLSRRSLPTRPRLSPWRRLVLLLTRLRASVRRT